MSYRSGCVSRPAPGTAGRGTNRGHPGSGRRTLGNVLLDLRSLKGMHPALPGVTAAGYVHRAALALQRQGHAPGVVGMVTVERDIQASCALDWDSVDQADAAQIDATEITEHGAEAVSLVLVSVARGWTIKKRLQRFQSADWLLVAPTGEDIALEVGGINGDFDRGRLRTKLEQARQVRFTQERFAAVVAFAAPEAVPARA